MGLRRALTFLLVNEEKGDGDLCLFFLALTHCVYVYCLSMYIVRVLQEEEGGGVIFVVATAVTRRL